MTEPASNPQLPMHPFLDALEAKIAGRILSMLKKMQGDQAIASDLVMLMTKSYQEGLEAFEKDILDVISAVTAKRNPQKLQLLKNTLENPALGTPLTSRLRRRFTSLMEQQVEVALVDELTQTLLEALRKHCQ